MRNKLFWVLIALSVLNLGGFFLSKFLIDATADRVIEKLQKSYSPSPYGPGFDPDKINPDGLKATKAYLEQQEDAEINFQPMTTQNLQSHGPNFLNITNVADAWRSGWEQDRGFNPAQ
jgi:hypothetical protein